MNTNAYSLLVTILALSLTDAEVLKDNAIATPKNIYF